MNMRDSVPTFHTYVHDNQHVGITSFRHSFHPVLLSLYADFIAFRFYMLFLRLFITSTSIYFRKLSFHSAIVPDQHADTTMYKCDAKVNEHLGRTLGHVCPVRSNCQAPLL